MKKDLSDAEFLEKIGPKIGKGFQGIVHEFGTDGKKVVKILRRFVLKNDQTDEINREIAHGLHASTHGVGPKIFDHRFIDDKAYIVMERVQPVDISKVDLEKVIQLFIKLIDAQLVNVDGSFATCPQTNKLVMIDFGVS